MKNKYDNEKLKNIALHGECLVKKFANKSQLVNKYLDNNNTKSKEGKHLEYSERQYKNE